MVSPLTVLLGVASVGLWGAVLAAVGSIWRRSQSADVELDPEDGCGCVEMWEFLSQRRSESRQSSETR